MFELNQNLRGSNAAASLKHEIKERFGRLPADLRGSNAAASLKRGTRRDRTHSGALISAAVMPRPH